MSKAWKQMVCLAWVLACAPLASAFGDTQFARVDTDDDDRPRALQLGIISYVFPDNQDGISVDLVGAIHIGDKAYYAELNERFRQYDALLYELVAPAGANVSEQVEKRKGLLSSAQIGMTKILDLSFQLDEIDYSQPNFVHADLTPSEFSQSMAERDESLYVYFWRIVFASIDEYAKDPLGLRDWQMLSAMLKSREDASLKIRMPVPGESASSTVSHTWQTWKIASSMSSDCASTVHRGLMHGSLAETSSCRSGFSRDSRG
jgi:hypothetical protein